MNEPFWYPDPSVLFAPTTWYVFVPTPTMPVSSALNAVVRFSIYLSALLFLTSLQPLYLVIVPLVMAVTVFLHAWFPQVKKMKETFVSSYVGESRTRPTPDNPFMNAQLTEIQDNPNRPRAADVTQMDVRNEVNQAFTKTSNIYMDTTDAFDLVQSQRNFHTVPEDDHAGLLQFLGKNARSDKLLSEGYVVAKGTVSELPGQSVSTAPTGTSPSTSR